MQVTGNYSIGSTIDKHQIFKNRRIIANISLNWILRIFTIMNRTIRAISFIALFCFLSFMGNSQNSDEPAVITAKFVIQNVHIIAKPGTPASFGSVLIEDGMIKQVGRTVTIPFDAEIIDGDSMYVYAGFIDALSHTGVKKSDTDDDRPKVKNPGYPPNDVAGITPELSAFDFISHKEKSIKDMRGQGFGISHVVPHGRLFPGQGAIILLDGNNADEMTIKKNTSTYSQFKGARGMYPQTIIGQMAKWREMYRSASYAKKHNSSFSTNPVGIKRPSYDKAIEALIPVVDKKQKVYFKASKAMEISRAMALQKDLGFSIVLSDVKQATHAIKSIKASKADILLSISLPKEEKKDEDKKKEEKDKVSDSKVIEGSTIGAPLSAKEVEKKKKEHKAKSKKEKKKKKKDPEKERLEARKKAAVAEYVSQAAMLEKNNIPFSFSFIDSKAKDLHPNIRRMIAAGLSEKTALAALTTEPAKLLGISNIAGTIEKGKLANIVMTDKPYFEEKSKIKYVFVEGTPFKTEVKKKKKKSEDGADGSADIVGKWTYEMNIPMPDNTGVILIEKTDDTYKVSIASVDDLTDFEEIEDIELDGNNLVFDFDVTDGMTMNVEMDLNFDGESFEGTVTAGQFGTFDMSGSRESKTPKF